MLDYAVYLVYRAGVYLLSLLPLKLLFALGGLAGGIAWLLAPGYRRLAARNIRTAFPHLSKTETKRLVREHFCRLGANVACSVKWSRWPLEKILRYVRVEHRERIEEFRRGGRPLIFLVSHLSSWELCAPLLPHLVPVPRSATIYQRIRNRHIDAHLRAARGRLGLEVFERSEGFSGITQLLREGGGIGILIDQHAGDHGIWTPFFERLASTTPLPALLAKRTRAVLCGFAIVTDGFARWRAVFEEPFESASGSTAELTAYGNRVLEARIRRAPADWFWVHNRWKTPNPNFLVSKYKRGVFVPAGTSLQPFRILVRSSNWLGDAVMSMPAVRAIKCGRPDAHVTIAAPEKIAAVWRELPEVDDVIVISKSSLFRTTTALRRAAPFEVAVLFPNSLRSALEVFLARIPRRTGFAGHSRRWLPNQCARFEPPRGIMHQATKFLLLTTTFGAENPTSLWPEPRAHSSTQPPRFALCPSAEYGPAKRWLPERFIEVAQEVSRETGARWVLFGTERDHEVGAPIAATLGDSCENRIGQTTIEQLTEELRTCALLLTNDTGTMHLAAMLGVPVIAIFGSTEPRLTAPLGRGHQVLRHHVECSPCFLRECPLDFRCMHAVSSAEVTAAVLQTARAQTAARVASLPISV